MYNQMFITRYDIENTPDFSHLKPMLDCDDWERLIPASKIKEYILYLYEDIDLETLGYNIIIDWEQTIKIFISDLEEFEIDGVIFYAR